jgi:hypothetical protein
MFRDNQVIMLPNHNYRAMRDGKKLFAYKYSKKKSNVTIILVHEILSSSYLMTQTSGLLREEVLILHFRGHEKIARKPGDVDYTDLYANNLADVIQL